MPILPTRGLTSREIIALLMMVAAQLIVTVVMLQMMMAGRADGSGLGIADALAAIQTPFGSAPSTASMSGGERVWLKENWDAEGGMDTSQYLLGAKQTMVNRITCHRTFVTEKKHCLVKVLWEVIEGVYELEVLVRGSGGSDDAVVSTGKGNGGADSGAQGVLQEDKSVADDTREGGKEGAGIGFRKEVEERMGASDFEGVLKMVKSGLAKTGRKIGAGKMEMGDGEVVDGRMKVVEEGKEKVQRGLLASWEILREMEEEMKGMEVWLRGMEGVLGEVVAEFLGTL